MSYTISRGNTPTSRDSFTGNYIQFYMTGVPAGYQVLSTTSIITATSDWTVYWGDGESTRCYQSETNLPYHRYAKKGNYTITITGDITAISAVSEADSPIITNNSKSNTFLTVVAFYGSAFKEVGNYTFYKCSNLRFVNPEGTIHLDRIGESAFESCIKLEYTWIVHVASVGKRAFFGCWNLKSDEDPGDTLHLQEVKEIYPSAFEDCLSLERVTIGRNIKNIDSRAFYGCKSLKKVYIKGAKPYAHNDDDGDLKFFGVNPSCTLTVGMSQPTWTNPVISTWFGLPVTVENDWTEIYSYTISNSKVCITEYKGDDVEVELPSTIGGYPVTSINGMSDNSRIKNLIIPSSVESIEGFSLSRCSSLAKVVFQGTDCNIGQEVLNGCRALTTLALPRNLIQIPVAFCQSCPSLTNIQIPSSVHSILGAAFVSCNGLKTITIPASVEYIGSGVFGSCSNLEEVIFEGNAPCFDSDTVFDAPQNIKAKVYSQSTGWEELVGHIPGQWGSLDFKYIWTDAFDYVNTGTSISIERYKGSATDVVIPSDIDGLPVTNIGYAAFENTSVVTITVPETIVSIADRAFANCSNLTSVTFLGDAPKCNSPWGTGRIPVVVKAYSTAYGWDSATWAADVKYMYEKEFEYGLIEHDDPNAPAEIEIKKYLGIGYHREVSVPSKINDIPVTRICDSAFAESSFWFDEDEEGRHKWYGYDSNGSLIENPTRIEAIDIPNGIKEICSSAFSYCSALTHINLPSSLIEIGDGAFQCTGLTSITLPKQVTSIGNAAFYSCSNLNSIVLSPRLEHIGASAFFECSNLSKLRLPSTAVFEHPEGLSTLEIKALYQEWKQQQELSRNDFELPETLLSIGEYAFYNCIKLKSVTIPSKISAVASGTFSHCTQLESIKLPNGISFIGSSAFELCWLLKEIDIPDSVVAVGDAAFASCTALERVNIKKAFSVGESAFRYCFSLIEFMPDETVQDGINANIGADAFRDCISLKRARINQTCDSVGDTAFVNCSALERVVFLGDMPSFVGSNIYGAETIYEYTEYAGGQYFNYTVGAGFYTQVHDAASGWDRTQNWQGYPLKGDLTDTFDWGLINGEIYINTHKGAYDETIEFPDDIMFFPITVIGNGAFYHDYGDGHNFEGSITRWPKYLREIGTGAFSFYSGHSYFPPFPATLIKLGDAAFLGTRNWNGVGWTLDTEYTFLGDAPVYGFAALGKEDADNPFEQGTDEYRNFEESKNANITVTVYSDTVGWKKDREKVGYPYTGTWHRLHVTSRPSAYRLAT